MTDNQVIKKDKHCIGCKHFWTCKGKPHSNPCLNKEFLKVNPEDIKSYKY